MLTEAEWEYAARAGTSTKYAFGDIITTAQANSYGERAPKVGSFAPNGFGLHDRHGSVPEWVQDCVENGYDGAPVDGSAHGPENCTRLPCGRARWSSVDPPGGMRCCANPMPEGASVAMAFSMALCGMRIVCTLPG